MTTLATLNIAALTALHNGAIVDFGAPEGFGAVAKFKSKAAGVTAIEALCAAGGLAVAFDGDTAMIVDALELPSEVVTGADGEGYGANDDDEGDKAALEASEGDDEGEGDEAPEFNGLGDGKGKARDWGFVTASEDWLKANPRGSAQREAYRKERRKAARMNRKAERAAKEAAQASAE